MDLMGIRMQFTCQTGSMWKQHTKWPPTMSMDLQKSAMICFIQVLFQPYEVTEILYGHGIRL